MPTIGAAVSAQTKDKFESVALHRSLTASRLAASLIVDFLARESGENTTSNRVLLLPQAIAATRGGAKTDQVFVRLEPCYYAELGRLAAERNWYRSTYLANLFQAHADRRPVLCDVEINAVRQVTRQIADMGRNINQIARKLNISLENAHVAMAMDLEVIRMALDLEKITLMELLRANIREWGVEDGQ